jgi:hypothetical protein
MLLSFLLTSATAAALPPGCLSGSWSYLGPSAFDHKTTPAWTNQVCLYKWTAAGPTTFKFVSPESCLDDQWKKTPATVEVSDDDSLTLTFVLDAGKTVKVVASSVTDCKFIDMEGGGVYTKSTVHPFFVPPHEWMENTAGWLLRAAIVTFEDGTRHLTPGYPTAYNGQWMRDGFYGISLLWDVANEKLQKDFSASAEWMFGHARSDGIMPQYCPPTGKCQYGQLCNDTVGAPGWQGCQDLDSAAFSIKFAHHIWSHLPANEQLPFYKRWASALELGMNATTSDPAGSGLLWSNTSRPMVGYGFQVSILYGFYILYGYGFQVSILYGYYILYGYGFQQPLPLASKNLYSTFYILYVDPVSPKRCSDRKIVKVY